MLPAAGFFGAALCAAGTVLGKVSRCASERSSSGDVKVDLRYVRDGSCGRRMTLAPVLVRDARQLRSPPTLSSHGFQLVDFQTELEAQSFFHTSTVQQRYYREICLSVQRATGADEVVAFHHNVRHQRNEESTDFVSNVYDTRVHGDYTPQSAYEIFEWQLGELAVPQKERAAYRDGHFLLINAWRNLNPEAVENDHLAVCDAGSVCPDHLLMLAAAPEAAASLPALSAESFAERVAGPMALVEFSELHRWYYFPALMDQELLIFKCFDSDPERSQLPGRYVLHSAMHVGAGKRSPSTRETQIITQCINPSWNQVLEENIKLPDDITLRPDVLITLLDSDEGSFEPMVQMRYKASEPEALPQEWKKSPRWFQLEPVPGGVPTQGKLLAAFELIPDVQAGPPRRLDAKTRKCRVDFFAIGARLRHDGGIDALNPILEVAWGRKEDNRATPKKCKHTDEAKRVVFNRFNWLQTVSLKVKLAEDDMFQEYLELKLLNETPNPKGDSEWQPVAHAAVHLTPHIPWVDPDRREKLAQQFSFKRQEEEGNKEEDDVLNQEEEEQVLNPKSGWARLKGKFKQMREGESYELMCKKMGWDVTSIEESNARVLGFKEYAVLDDETEQKNAEFLKNQLFDLEDAEESEWNATLLQFNRGFTWPQRSIASSGIDKHADYAAPLEENLEMEKTDYSSTMLFLGSEWGEPRNLGTLKYCVRIVELDKDDKEKDSPHAVMAQEEWDGLLKRIKERFEKSKDLVVRAYVLSGDGLRPPSGSSDCNSYVWSRIDAGGSEQNPVYNLKDNLTVRKHTLHPQFNKCHAFGSVRFPDHCVMTLSLVEVTSARFGSGASETVIGSTEIDLEDRWFNSHYQEMVATDEVPIESRHLQTSGSVFSKGHIRLWLDIMYNQRQACPAPDAFAQERPIESLPSTDPLPFELRVAVFKVVDIQPPEGNSEPSVKASGKMTLDDGKDLFEETDTHFGCDDGTATLNWRLVFKNVMIPCKQPRLTVQIWNDNMLASDEVLAEVTLDFSKDFLIARKNNTTVDFPKGSLYMYHPAFPGEVRGVIDLEAILLPADEVRERPAGVGREEPNQDPFLDPNDPHLVAHRSRIANLKIVKSAKALAGGLLAGAQLLLMLKLIAMGASGIFAAIMSILMVTK